MADTRAALDALNKKYGVSGNVSTPSNRVNINFIPSGSTERQSFNGGSGTSNRATSAMDNLRNKYGTVDKSMNLETAVSEYNKKHKAETKESDKSLKQTVVEKKETVETDKETAETKEKKKGVEGTRFYNQVEEQVEKEPTAVDRAMNSSFLNTASSLQALGSRLAQWQGELKSDDLEETEAMKAYREKTRADAENLMQKSQNTAYRAEQEMEKATEGKSGIEQVGLQLVRVGTDVAQDLAVGKVAKVLGAGLRTAQIATNVNMALRAFGNAMTSAMNEKPDADWDKVSLYGATVGGIAVATNRFFGSVLKGVYGKGMFDRITSNVMARLGSSPKGVQVVADLARKFNEEGSEEFAEDFLNAPVKSIYNDKTIGENIKELKISDMLYDYLIGGLFGSIVGGAEMVNGRLSANTDNAVTEQNVLVPEAEQNVTEQTNVAAEPENAPQSVTEPNVSMVDNLVEMVKQGGNVSNNMAERVMADANAMAELGIDTVGKTKSQIRSEIKAAINTKATLVTPEKTTTNDVNIPTVEEKITPDNVNNNNAEEIAELEDLIAEMESDRSKEENKNVSEYIGREIENINQKINYLKSQQYAEPNDLINSMGAAKENFTMPKKTETKVSRSVDTTEILTDDRAKAMGLSDENLNARKNELEIQLKTTTDKDQRKAIKSELDEVNKKLEELQSEYNTYFEYETRPEANSVKQATEELYFNVENENGEIETKFVLDAYPEVYADIVKDLKAKDAWTANDTEMAMMIESELQGRALKGEISNETFVDFLDIVDEHTRESARAMQVLSKWSATNNENGGATAREAWNALQKTDLDTETKNEIFKEVLSYNEKIKENKDGRENLIDIIIEIGNKRGTLSNIFGKHIDNLEKNTRKNVESFSTPELVQFAYNSSKNLVNDVIKTDLGRKIKTIQVLNMLSSPRTIARNILGNTTFYGVDAISMRGAAIIDMGLSKLTGTRSTAMEKSVFSKDVINAIVSGIKHSLAEITLDVDMGANSRYGQSTSRTYKSSKGFVENVVSKLERNSAYTLVVPDEASKAAARAVEIETQKLIDEGKLKTDNENFAAEQAQELALIRTFQNNSKLSGAIQAVHDVLNMLVGVGDSGTTIGKHKVHAFGAGDIVAPFTKVAGNLVNVSLMYSPANAIKGGCEIVEVLYQSAKGNDVDVSKQSKGVSDLARGLNGTALAYVAAMLAKAGVFKRADDEEDSDVKNLNQTEGISGLQINIDAMRRWKQGGSGEWQVGDELFDISSLEPLNFIFSLGFELQDDSIEKENSLITQVGEDVIRSFSDSSSELPIVSNTANFVKDTMLYKKNPLDAAAQAVGRTAVASITPNLLSGIAKGIDDKARSTTSGETNTDIIVDTFKSRIPFLRETLPTKTNSLGEEQKVVGNDVQRFLNAVINPLGVNEYNQSDISKEMERVREATGKATFYPTSKVQSEMSYTDDDKVKHTVTLDYEQKQKYKQVRGRTQVSISTSMVGNEKYKSSNAETQAQLLDVCYNYAQQVARGSVLGENAVNSWVKNSQNAPKDLGISQTDYLYYYNKFGKDDVSGNIMVGLTYEKTCRMVNAGMTLDEYADMNAAMKAIDNVKKQDVVNYLNSTGKTKAEKRALFTAWNSKWKNPF